MQDLVEQAKGGDLEAFSVLVDRYKDMAYGTAYAILGNFHDAQDMAQEAFIQAWQKLGNLKNCGSFPGWLCRITRNLSLDRVRRRREQTERIDDVADTLPDPVEKGPERRAEQTELREAVMDAIRSLSEPNRLATALFYIDGYSIEEVAGFLEVPAGTVKRRLHDSRNQLRERMVDMVEDTMKSIPLPDDFARKTLQKIGDFACLGILGYGPLGSVYLCDHPVLKHKVAVKLIAEGRPEVNEYVGLSYAAINRLNHPCFVKAFSCGEHEGRAYVVMEFLQGMSWQAWLSEHKACPLWDLLKVMVQLVDACDHAHSRDVIIGVFGPGTIVMLFNDAPIIVDIAPVKPLRRKEKRTWMSRYLAPECAKGEWPDKQTDIWNLGVMMYELLAGKPLVDGKAEEDAMGDSQAALSPDTGALKDRAPGHILSVLEKCLEKAPKDRLPNTAELLYALEEAQFAELIRLKGYDIQRLLRDVEPATLAPALGGIPEEITTHISSNVGDEVAAQIRQKMTDNPPSPDAAHAARVGVVTIADRLLKEQRISF